jgi:hypothetical protein
MRSVNATRYDERTLWYRRNLRGIKIALKISLFVLVASIVVFISINLKAFRQISLAQYAMLATFPLIAYCYTFSSGLFLRKKIRQIVG